MQNSSALDSWSHLVEQLKKKPTQSMVVQSYLVIVLIYTCSSVTTFN